MDYGKLTIEELEKLAPTDSGACWELIDRKVEEEEMEDQGLSPDNEPEEEEADPTQVFFTEAPSGHNGYE